MYPAEERLKQFLTGDVVERLLPVVRVTNLQKQRERRTLNVETLRIVVTCSVLYEL